MMQKVTKLTAGGDAFGFVHGCAEEVRRGPSYGYDNARRSDRNLLVVQWTLAGAAFFADAKGTRLVPAGHAMLFTHREPSRYGYPPEAKEPYRHRYIALEPSAPLRAVFDQLRHEFGSVVALPLRSEAATLFDEVFERFRARSFRDRLQEAELLYRLLTALYREQMRASSAVDPIEFGYQQLRNHFRSPLNLKTLAAKCGVSREHFMREFKRRHGETPGVFLRRLRLEHARAMLAATEEPIEAVALASGFATANSFARAYRTKFGRSPGEERRATNARAGSRR